MKKQLCQQSLDFENEIREFRGQPQALKLLPINRSNGFENVLKRDDELQEISWHNNNFKKTQVIKAKNKEKG